MHFGQSTGKYLSFPAEPVESSQKNLRCWQCWHFGGRGNTIPTRVHHLSTNSEGQSVGERTIVALPLDGIRVIEVGQALAGPLAGVPLADMGADVIKIEKPEGDDARIGVPLRA